MRTLLLLLRFLVVWACAACSLPPPRMCSSEGDCGARASCVAGRCVAHGATPAIDAARRLVFDPVEVGWVRRGGGEARDVATLGRGDGAVVFLRFDAPLPPEATVLEAYLVLERAGATDADPAPIALHAARVVDAWDGASLSWARQPRVEGLGLPVTRVSAGSGPVVRLDVRELVARWRRRARGEMGVAVACDGTNATGVGFALAPLDVPRDRRDPVLAPRAGALGAIGDARTERRAPRLELYVR